jgi:hypothetical protein
VKTSKGEKKDETNITLIFCGNLSFTPCLIVMYFFSKKISPFDDQTLTTNIMFILLLKNIYYIEKIFQLLIIDTILNKFRLG